MISLARVRGFQGRRGEVAAEIKTDFPERFAAGAKFFLTRQGATESREYLLENAWFHKGNLILKFAGVNSISDAEGLRDCEVMVTRSERKQLPPGNFYLDDLIGCKVLEGDRLRGSVRDWEDTGGGILLHVTPPTEAAIGDEILIPFAQEICTEIDVQNRVIQVRLPEGLLELNSSGAMRRPLSRN